MVEVGQIYMRKPEFIGDTAWHVLVPQCAVGAAFYCRGFQFVSRPGEPPSKDSVLHEASFLVFSSVEAEHYAPAPRWVVNWLSAYQVQGGRETLPSGRPGTQP